MMLRCFRGHWKKLFMKMYPSKSDKSAGLHFHWCPSTRREKVKKFWLSLNLEGLDQNTYKDFEYILFKLINPTYTDLKNPKDLLKTDNLETHGIAIPLSSNLKHDTIKKIFGNAPNSTNLKLFFENKTIKMLWWNQSNGFFTSQTM